MKLTAKALELRGQFIQSYSDKAGIKAAEDALSNDNILSGINAFFQMIADMHEAGFDGNFDTTAKSELVSR